MPVNNDNDENDEYTRATKAVVDDTMRTDVLGPNIERVLRDYKPVNDLVKKISVDGIKNDTDTKKAIDEAEAATKDLTHGTAILSFNYGGHQEIIDAVNTLRKTLSAHKKVTAQIFEQFLYTPDVPPCDLIVRTSGEQRLSNFMLWRSAYSELIFVKKSWPDMTKRDITAILNEYAKRSRRFGG